jgi:hypothetical protein
MHDKEALDKAEMYFKFLEEVVTVKSANRKDGECPDGA